MTVYNCIALNSYNPLVGVITPSQHKHPPWSTTERSWNHVIGLELIKKQKRGLRGSETDNWTVTGNLQFLLTMACTFQYVTTKFM